MTAAVEPFRIDVPQAVLDDLGERLRRARLPGAPADAGWTYGTSPEYLERLLDYWRREYDWRCGGGPAEPHAAVHGLRRRLPHPSRLRARQRSRPASPRAHARLARILRRVRGGDRASRSPGAIRRPRRGCLRRGGADPARLWLVEPAAGSRHHARYREALGRSDDFGAGLPALRGAGRRLGQSRDVVAGRGRRATRGGHSSEHDGAAAAPRRGQRAPHRGGRGMGEARRERASIARRAIRPSRAPSHKRSRTPSRIRRWGSPPGSPRSSTGGASRWPEVRPSPWSRSSRTS